eukprot:1720114-Amphidinium_carterae.2
MFSLVKLLLLVLKCHQKGRPPPIGNTAYGAHSIPGKFNKLNTCTCYTWVALLIGCFKPFSVESMGCAFQAQVLDELLLGIKGQVTAANNQALL